ncbi:RHS repeat-associated core domain-containing protein, partial [Luteimonas huabeiensis]|uniref:RHS repeat-associated core domain-containing protein n=1 Tax=Luteimonas huabeiensis TaxID=1244513 RepID=UPI001F1A9932
LVYMQQRYYDPGIGLFLSVDPVTAYDQPLVTFNRYRYANSNPYKFTDPDGRFGVVGGIIGGLIEVGIQMGVEGKSFSQIDKTDVAVAVAVGAVTGGLGGRLATQAARGTITAGQAAIQTGMAGGAASALGSGAKDIANGEAPDGVKMAVSGAIGGAASGAGARIGLSSVSNLERAAASSSPGAPNIASTTQSALRVGEVATTGGQASAQIGVDAAAGAVDKAVETQLDKRR